MQESTSKEILSVAVFEPHAGKQQECLAAVRELAGILAAKEFSRDRLFRDAAKAHRYVLADPAALRCWARMAELIDSITVYESLEEVPL
jgi:hypothetical protein